MARWPKQACSFFLEVRTGTDLGNIRIPVSPIGG